MADEDKGAYTQIGFLAEVNLVGDTQERIEALKDDLVKALHKDRIYPSLGTSALALAAFLSVEALAVSSGVPERPSTNTPRTLLVCFYADKLRFYLDAPVPPKRD